MKKASPKSFTETLETKQVHNILQKLQSGKVLSQEEKDQVAAYQKRQSQPIIESSLSRKGKVSIYDSEVAGDICARLAAGETIRAICRSYGHAMERQFWARMASDETWVATIARAREAGQDALTAETIDIADDCTEANVQSARLRIWARQWYASKLAPKKYGDRLVNQHEGPNGGPVLLSWKSRSTTPPATKS